MSASIMDDMTKGKIKEIMTNNQNKFIYFYRKSALNIEEYQRIEEFAQKIESGMRVVPYKINLDEHYDELIEYLKERNPKTAQ